jgi:methyl-accepting chemotaxis protein
MDLILLLAYPNPLFCTACGCIASFSHLFRSRRITLKFRSIQMKITMLAGCCLVLTAGAIILNSAITLREQTMRVAESRAQAAAEEYAGEILSKFEDALAFTRGLASVLGATKNRIMPIQLDRYEAQAMLRESFLQSPQFFGGGTAWEPDAFDGRDAEYVGDENYDASGRMISYWYQDDENGLKYDILVDYDNPQAGTWYFMPKKLRHEVLTEPYSYPVGGVEVLMSTVASPILVDGTFYGVTTVDFTLDFLQHLADDDTLYNGAGKTAIITNDGTVAGMTGVPEAGGKPWADYDAAGAAYYDRLVAGETVLDWSKRGLEVFVPLNLGETGTPWWVHVMVPREVALANVTSVMWHQIGIGGICIIAALLLLWGIARSLAMPIRKGAAMAKEIARGDLSRRLMLNQEDEVGMLACALNDMVESLQQKAELAEAISRGELDIEVPLASEKDQLGKALQCMTENLNDLLAQVQVAGEQIMTGASQISDASQSLSRGATESAASMEEISASMTQLTSQTTNNAEYAEQAKSLSLSSKQGAEQGDALMTEMVNAMRDIEISGKDISKIIKVIDDIAFQTNLLALNAAVEAARAGQHGKGFAVVAEEVRNLAARSAKAAHETSDLIESSVLKTHNGAEIAQRTAAALAEIVAATTKVSDLVAEITAASKEQSQGIQEINQGLEQIESVTQQNTANAEETAASTEELSGQALQMNRMLEKFKIKKSAVGTQVEAPTRDEILRLPGDTA